MRKFQTVILEKRVSHGPERSAMLLLRSPVVVVALLVSTLAVPAISQTGQVAPKAAHSGPPTTSTVSPLGRQGDQWIKDCDVCPQLVAIPAGQFSMGSSVAEQAMAGTAGVSERSLRREGPRHRVNVRSFAVGRFAVTKGEFAAFISATEYKTEAERNGGCNVWTGSQWTLQVDKSWRSVGFQQDDDHPVVCVSWNDAQEYAKWISHKSGKRYRLLTEAEREYVARGRSETSYWWGDSLTTDQANYDGNYSYNGSPNGAMRHATLAVHAFRPNPFGLFNVHGNVWEWVEDCFHGDYTGAPADGSAWVTECSGRERVFRGGSWADSPANLRAADRSGESASFRINSAGFRLARSED